MAPLRGPASNNHAPKFHIHKLMANIRFVASVTTYFDFLLKIVKDRYSRNPNDVITPPEDIVQGDSFAEWIDFICSSILSETL